MNSGELVLLITFAFLPAILYIIWIRNTEKYNLERWTPIAICFIWGATIAVIAALILEMVFRSYFYTSPLGGDMIGFTSAVLIAPFAEEITKPLVLSFNVIRRELDELEDGFIYGAAAGLGFAATENLLYGSVFLTQGLAIFVVLMILRSFGGCLLHASATAFTGYGYGKVIMNQSSLLAVLPFLLLAMVLHAAYNFLVSYQLPGLLSGFLLALVLVFYLIVYIRKRIVALDMASQ